MKTTTIRQGDIRLVGISALPEGLSVKDNVLALGETTGHSHRIENAVVYTDAKGMQYVQVQETATLMHEEHKELSIPSGIYKVMHQREYSPQENRRVMD